MTPEQLRRLGLTILLALPISFISAFALAAFTTGFQVCTDCSTPIDRAFLGFIFIPLAVLSGGNIPNTAQGASSGINNVWPLTYSLWAAFLPVALVVFWLFLQRSSRTI